MIVSEFSTDCLPSAERFGRWQDVKSALAVPSLLRSDREDDFRATVRSLDLGPVLVSVLRTPSVESRRTPRLIRRSDPGWCQLMLPLTGQVRFVQARCDAVIGPGDLVLCDAGRPWHGWVHADDGGRGTAERLLVRLPRALLPVPEAGVARLSAVRIPGREGLGALLAGYLTQLIADTADYQPADGARLAGLTVDLLAAWCAHRLDSQGEALPPATRQRVLLTRIHSFIERHLGEPGLSPTAIAAAHHISVRYLHRIFHEQGMTVAGRIRRRRLERCHRDLADPRLAARPIHAIAGRWGFTDPANFSRAFRTAYGMPPSDYRLLALRSPAAVRAG